MRRLIDRELVLLVLFSLFAVAPLASPGYFFGAHDANHSVFFLVQFDAAIRDGALWPRWGPDHALGYGYPLWLLYAPLAYYVAEGFHLLGLGFTAAVKATAVLAFLFGGWGMFLLLRHWFGSTPAGRAAALVGGLVYVYAPYHLVALYVRAALAEFVALAWFPWVLLAFDNLVEHGGPRRIALAALAFAGLLLTHTGTILTFTPLLLTYLAFAIVRHALRVGRSPLARNVQDATDFQQMLTALGLRSPVRLFLRDLWHTALRVAAGGLLALGLAAIFLLPLLAEQRYVVQSQWVQGTYGYRLHFVYPSQFLDPFWGFGYSDDPAGTGDGMSFQLGIVAAGLALAGAVVGLRPHATQRSTVAFFVVATIFTLLATMPVAQPLWDAVPPAALIQFPWRLLSVASLCLAILAGAAVAGLLSPPQADQPAGSPANPTTLVDFPVSYVVALLVVLASFPYTAPQYTDITPVDESPLAIVRFETRFPDMVGITAFSQQVPTDSPLVAQYQAGQPLQKAVLLRGGGEVETLRVGGASVTARVTGSEPATVLFYTYDFPGWRATVDGQPVPHRPEPPYGLIAVDVPPGVHEVAIRHGTTPARTAGTIVSLLSVLIVIGLFIAGTRRRQAAQPQRAD